MTPLKAIRAKCLDCCCDSALEVKLCPIPDCPLYIYRFGHNPNATREMTDEQRKAVAERLAAFRRTTQASTVDDTALESEPEQLRQDEENA